MSDEYQNQFSQEYSEESFWKKVKKHASIAGVKAIYACLLLYYTLSKTTTPGWAKGVILGALGYFISPLDAVPDLVPIVGYTDDLGVLVLAIGTVATYIDDDVKDKARKKIKDWFPKATEEEFFDIDNKIG